MTDIANLVVKIGADTSGLTKGFGDANKQMGVFGTGVSKAQIGVLGIATAVVGIGVEAVKLAVEWETAFAGVEKTVEGSAEQLGLLEDQLRDMATDTSNPVAGLDNAAVTLAKIAEMGGSLGIATNDLGAFTQTIAELAMTTDLTAENAATMTAQFANITGMKVEDYDNFGSALVDLGNKMAATEGQIIEFAQRMGAAGTRAGMTQADILGFAGAMASLGLDAEAGGTAFSQTINTIVEAVAVGGPKLDALAEAAGVTAESFRTNWEDDPAAALVDFLEGLGKMSPADQIATLDALGLSGIRVSDALSRMAGNTTLVQQGLDVANDAWIENTALTAEAEKRFKTTEAQMNLLGNNVKELGMSLGEQLLPVVNDVVTGVTKFVGALNDGNTAAAGNQILDLAQGLSGVELPDFDTVADGWTKVGDAINLIATDDAVQGGLGQAFLDSIESAANSIGGFMGVDLIQLPDFASVISGWQTFFDSLGILVTNGIARLSSEMNTLAVGIRTIFRDVEEMASRAQIFGADANTLLGRGGAVNDLAKEAGTSNVNAIESAKNLEQQINDSLAAGDINIDISKFVTSDPAAIAAKIADPQLIQDAITQAMAEGDQAALNVLLPIATELGLDVQGIVDQFAGTITEATAESYPATLVADVLVTAGKIDVTGFTTAVQSALNQAGAGVAIPGMTGVQPAQAAPHLASGGSILSDGLAYLHRGEVVLNQGQQSAASNGARGGSIGTLVIQANDVDKLLFDLKVQGIDLKAMANPA